MFSENSATQPRVGILAYLIDSAVVCLTLKICLGFESTLIQVTLCNSSPFFRCMFQASDFVVLNFAG